MNLICGINPVLEALAAGTRHFDRLLVVKGLRNRRLAEAIRRATRLGVPLRFEMRDTLDRLAGGVPHQGIIAVVSAKPVLSLEEVLETARDPALLVVLDGVEDPRNLGAVLRTVEAAGADGIVLPERHSAGLSETVGRASAGALEHARVARVGNLVQALRSLKERGVWVVGFDAAGTERWDGVDFKRPVALVLGGEGRGIRRLVREHCDHLVSIPQFGHVSSLNVSVAAGIALYEVVRQRGAIPSAVRPIPARPPVPSAIVGPDPDDEEVDPGAAPEPPRRTEEGAVGDDEMQPAVIARVDIHGDDVAWGQAPMVLKPVESRRGHRALMRRRKGGARRRHGGEPRNRPAEPAASGEAPEDAASEPRTGRRRRRRRRPGAPGGSQGVKPTDPGAPDGGREPGAGPPSSGGEPGAENPSGRRRSRGRRRRRRR